MRLCLATNNKHKVEEIRAALGNRFHLLSLQEIGCTEELPETQNTISGNSFQKAEWVYQHYSIAAIADDSGLEVEALDGAPGVDSAFYAGPQKSFSDNMDLLLKNMEGVGDRRACFKTILTLMFGEKDVHQFEGTLKGTILTEKRGSSGFGYDPLFLPDGSDRTLGEMTLAEKNKISHRGKAVQKLADFLKSH